MFGIFTIPSTIPEKKCNGSSARLGIRGLVGNGVRVQAPVPVPVLIRAQGSVATRGRVRARVRVEVRRTKISNKCCPKFSRMSHSEPKMGPKMTLWETRVGLLGGKFPQVSHSWPIGSEGKPKLAQILCGSPDFGDPATDAPVPPRAPPPYPLDTFCHYSELAIFPSTSGEGSAIF